MKAAVILFSLFLVIAPLAGSQEPTQNSDDSTLRVMLLGTRSGPAIDPQRCGHRHADRRGTRTAVVRRRSGRTNGHESYGDRAG